jgi:hypothetical protein
MGERWPTMPPGFNDKISSIRVFRGAVVAIFEDDGFNGERMRVDSDVDTLKRFPLRHDPYHTWNDQISSLAVFRADDDWDRGHREGASRTGTGTGARAAVIFECRLLCYRAGFLVLVAGAAGSASAMRQMERCMARSLLARSISTTS